MSFDEIGPNLTTFERTLIVPGYRGSGENHWQTWLQSQIADARRVADIDYERPVLAWWASQICRAIDAAQGPVWIVAHSFGCLASVVAMAERPGKVAGAMLVAPADPARFTIEGFALRNGQDRESIIEWLPAAPLPCPTLMVASTDDPWLRVTTAAYWAERWGAHLRFAGASGHINPDSGFGPWAEGLKWLRQLQASDGPYVLGSSDEPRPVVKGRGSPLSRLRHQTRGRLSTL